MRKDFTAVESYHSANHFIFGDHSREVKSRNTFFWGDKKLCMPKLNFDL